MPSVAETRPDAVPFEGESLDRGNLMHGRFLVAMIFVGYVLNFIDRQIVTVILEPIKAELQISDGALGLLTGLSFAIFYAIMGLPIATLADRFSRRTIISACMALWSGATIAFGLASSFPQMLIARMAVGTGEAGFAPAAFSMLADRFPQNRRTMATAMAAMGATLGTALGLGVGAHVAEVYGWRAAVFIAGGPGLLFSLFFYFTVKDPPRGLSGGVAAAGEQEGRSSIELLGNGSYVFVVLAATNTCFVMFGCSHWMPTFIIRSYATSEATAGLLLGPLLGVVGALSLVISGYLVDRLSTRDIRWAFWVPAIMSLLAVPALALAYISHDRTASLLLFAAAYLGMLSYSAPLTAIIQLLVPLSLRARATAIYFLITTLIGFGFGPVVVGYGSEAFAAAGQDSLRYALLSLSPVLLLSPILLVIGAWRLPAWARKT